MRKLAAICLLAVAVNHAPAYVTGYHVDPVKASWSGWTRTIQGQDLVSQVITCNFDSVVYCELFAEDRGITD